jgi:7-keto-8-aminopelargonate synthetase-like enzyme
MFNKNFLQQIDDDLIRLQNSGLYKNEYQISGQQSAEIKIWHNNDKKKVLNFCV